jgi:hypothetical protein
MIDQLIRDVDTSELEYKTLQALSPTADDLYGWRNTLTTRLQVRPVSTSVAIFSFVSRLMASVDGATLAPPGYRWGCGRLL